MSEGREVDGKVDVSEGGGVKVERSEEVRVNLSERVRVGDVSTSTRGRRVTTCSLNFCNAMLRPLVLFSCFPQGV